MKMVYVPAGLMSALEAAGLRSSRLSDPAHLLSILSSEDVAFYLCANATGAKMPAYITRTFNSLIGDDGVFLQKALEASQSFEVVFGETMKRFLDDKQSPVFIGKLVFKIVDPELIVFTHDGVSDQNVGNIDMEIRAQCSLLIQALHAVLPFEQIVRTPLFAEYSRATKRQSGGMA